MQMLTYIDVQVDERQALTYMYTYAQNIQISTAKILR